ncbi:MAG: WYL domain-containing protein [Paramuribaculum sp.]|nr:WYL domain-containing protein [Paramuribaculum sp.]
MRLTPDLVQELLSMGSAVTVVSPPELRAMMVTQLRDTLANYDK